MLPLLAFAVVLVSAGTLWRTTISPIASDAPAPPPLGLKKAAEPEPLLENAALGQISHAGTNEIARPLGRD